MLSPETTTKRNCWHQHSTTSVSHRSDPHISHIFLKIYEIKTFISKTPVQVISTMQWRLNPAPAQSRCPAGHRGDLCWRQKILHRDILRSGLGVTGVVPPQMFLLHNLPCICSHQISLVLLKTHIKQDNFLTRRKWQSIIPNRRQAGNLFLSGNTISWTIRYNFILEQLTPAAQSRAKPPLSMPALVQCWTNTSPHKVQDYCSPQKTWCNSLQH